jgi:hypothetical protein
VGQAKRRHVLRYIAARERAGILGTGPFDLDEALVKLDAWMTAGCRWALAVAVELALTGQRPGCTACAGIGAQASTFEQATGIDGRTYWLGVDFAACSTCRGTGHNTHASLPWPAWLRRKGREAAGDEALRRAAMLGHSIPDWARFAFSATCETFVECTDEARRPVPVAERRAETRTRSFPRGAHRLADPVLAARIVSIPSEPYSYTSRLPAWLRGDMRHADQRRERALASASKAERARQAMRRQGVEDLLRGSLTTARAATASDPAEQTRLAVEAARLYAAGALGVGASTVARWESGQWHSGVRGTGRTQAVLEQAAQHAGPVTVVAADELQVSMLRQRLRQLGAGHVQVCSVPSVVAGRLRGRSDLVLWDHYALERFPGVDPALYSRDAVAG